MEQMAVKTFSILRFVTSFGLLARICAISCSVIHVFRNHELFSTFSSTNALLEFVGNTITNKAPKYRSYCINRGRVGDYYFVDSDLESMFCSKPLVDAFWKILNIISDSEHVELQTQDQICHEDGSYTRKILKEVIPNDTTAEERLGIIKLLSFSGVLGKDIKFLLDCCFEENIFKLDNKSKVIEWVVDKLYETPLQFEETESNCNVCEDENSIIKRRFQRIPKCATQLPSSAKFIFCCLDLIYERIASASVRKNDVEMRQALYLFCKIAASLEWHEIEKVRLDKEGEKLRETMLLMFYALEIHECVFTNGEAVQGQYFNVIGLIQAGTGMYYNASWFGARQNWIHVGPKTLEKLKTYGKDFIEVFWRALGNIFRGIDGATLIHVTISNTTNEKLSEPAEPRVIEFDKYKYWLILKDYECRECSTLSTVCTKYCKLSFDHLELSFTNEENLPYYEFCCIITLEYFSKEHLLLASNETEEILPFGRYIQEYTFHNEDSGLILRILNESIYSRPDRIGIRICKPGGGSNDLLKDDFESIANKKLEAIAEGLKRYFADDSNVTMIKLHTELNIGIGIIFGLAAMTDRCTSYVFCLCYSKLDCPIKDECDKRIRQSERIILEHRDN